ncbi:MULTISPECIES: Gfo/Idh/MocA family protein [unclassified Jeotgalibaca]|uniref:Gfo/Idh/MocA family protein n=1 Tax=unclassified Jeotgalibaca TaxID=2621505 RepID=UPI003FD04DBA
MLKIAVIGIGNIAQKAYLPVISQMRSDIEWHLVTRNQQVLNDVGQAYGFRHLHQSIEALEGIELDAAFVHNATHVHYETIKFLLKKGVHVYVDKPISENLAESKELLALAEEKRVLLTVGFNRRFAPMVKKLKDIPDKKMIFIQKDRVNNDEEVRFAIYDLFIHILDTALYLLDDPIIASQSRITEEDGKLKRVWLCLETEQTTAIVSMNYEAGAKQEKIEVQSLAGIHRVTDLTELQILEKNRAITESFGDWTGTLEKRGFAPLIESFIEGVSTGINPVSLSSSEKTHELCEKIVQEHLAF